MLTVITVLADVLYLGMCGELTHTEIKKKKKSQCVQSTLGKVDEVRKVVQKMKLCKVRVFGFHSRYDGKLSENFKKSGE